MANYSEKLRDPRWQQRRREILKIAGYCCERCDQSDLPLHVHHRTYHQGVESWEYADDELECLCEDCHKEEHGLLEEHTARIISANGTVKTIFRFRGNRMEVYEPEEDQ